MNHTRHEDHPGFVADTCSLRITVTSKPFSTTQNGFACGHTGGHCLPDKVRCERYKKEADEFEMMFGEDYG